MGCSQSKAGPDLFDSTVVPHSRSPTATKEPEEKSRGPRILLPNSPGFNPSANGRNGLSPGEVYDLQNKEELGSGTFGMVYKCKHSLNVTKQSSSLTAGDWTRGVAIKIPKDVTPLSRRGTNEYDDLEEQCEELQTLLKVRNVKGVLHLYEYFYFERKIIIVSELLGQELSDWMADQAMLTEKKIRLIATHLLKAIKHLHEKGIVHRDLKLQNILIPSNKNLAGLKIVDFGLAKDLRNGMQATEFCGSYGYMAPEIYQNEPYRFEVDMFSFGVILFRLLSGGEKPFPQKQKQQLRRATERLEYDINQACWENVSDEAKKLVKGLLTPNYQRLSAAEAEDQPWCSSADETHLVTVLRPSIDNKSSSGAVNLSQRPSADGDTVPGRFWVNPNLLGALEDITRKGAYCGRVLGQRGEGDSVLLFIDEVLPSSWKRLPHYLQTVDTYTEADCRDLFGKIVSALQIFHEAGVAHRYLHMENIVVDDKGNLKLTGINYSQPCHRPLTGHFNKKFSWFAYHAPEINEAFTHDERVDLWSLGAILFTLLCGTFPFPGSGDYLRYNKANGIVEFETIPVSPSVEILVRKLLQPDPNNRIQLADIWQDEWMLKDDQILRRQDLSLAKIFMGDWMSRTAASLRDSRNMSSSSQSNYNSFQA